MTTPEQGMPQEAAPAPGSGGGNGIAIAGLVVSIIALLIFWMPFVGLGVAVVGLILSIMGVKKAGQVGGTGKGAAIGGIVVAVLGILGGAASSACGAACAVGAHSAAQMQDELNAKAKAAGYKDFDEWKEKDPDAAAKASAEAAKSFAEAFGADTSKLDEAIEKMDQAAKDQAAKEQAGQGAPAEGDGDGTQGSP